VVDRALRTIAQRRAELDAEEAHWVREAEALQIWRPLGMVSMLDYLERTMGYAPRTGQDRLRVARLLGALPQLTAALTAGKLAFSAVRELTRVATPATETEWIATAVGKNLRQIEELVADHREGDRPGDPPDPKARRHVVRYELSAETFALLRKARTLVDDEHGTNRSDDTFVAALCSAVIDGPSTAEPTGRAKFQIAVTVCEHCRRGWQEGGGAQIPIGAAAVERAMCDAQHIGSIDGDAMARAYQDIPPSVERFVWRRDGGRCRVPGCRSSRGLELHHLVHRADGGSHDALNLALICSACHQSHHAGTLTITGTADQLEVRRSEEASSVGEPRAHVGAPVEPSAEVPSRTHGSALREPSAEVQTGVHVGPRIEPSAEVQARAHLGPRIKPIENCHSRAHVSVREQPPTQLDVAVRRAQTKDALIGLGWKPAIASAAVAAAWATMGSRATLEQLIVEALRQCPRSFTTTGCAPQAP
jgi:hypothetical protein